VKATIKTGCGYWDVTVYPMAAAFDGPKRRLNWTRLK
jgi:hypothetical protein